MDDLNGLDWSSTSNSSKPTAPQGTGNYYASVPVLRPTPSPQTSGRNTPLSKQAAGLTKPFAPPKSSTPDSFANLVSFGGSKTSTLSLQEQQVKLQAEKARQETERKRQYEAQYGNHNAWEGLGTRSNAFTPPTTSRSTTPFANPIPASVSRTLSPPAINGANATVADDDDLFAAFNKDTLVDKSSHFPPAHASPISNAPALAAKQRDLSQPQAWEKTPSQGLDFGDDDDPFGLNQLKPRPQQAPATSMAVDDDDFLGDLAKPVDQVRRADPSTKQQSSRPSPEADATDPWDAAVAELVDMGFSAEQSRRALTESGSGLDIQAAVGWILNDAHRQAKQKQQGRDSSRGNRVSNNGRSDSPPSTTQERRDLSERRDGSQPRRESSRTPTADVDLSKTAAAVGNNIFKTANSLWKTSQKKVQRAVADFQQDSDPNQPKWMRDAAEREAADRKSAAAGKDPIAKRPEVTDEALLLEGGGRPQPRKTKAPESRPQASLSSRDVSSVLPPRPADRASPVPRWQQTQPVDPRSRVNKQAVEEQSAQAYISPARRKKTPQPIQQDPEPDLLFSASSTITSQAKPSSVSARTSQRPTPVPSKPSTPVPTRPKAPPRQIPSLSAIALKSSTQHRNTGTEYFKRGDYASAHQSYSSSLAALPSQHPITIILLCNRALTGLKTGVPKEAVSDADSALSIIGVSRGDGETIDLGPGDGGGQKEMKDFYGKALTRKAEALEQMERWADARDVWKTAVEHGVGGPTAIQGRQRCDKALAPKAVPRAAAPRAKPKPAVQRPSALSDLNGSFGQDSEAVKRLRAQNQEAEKADDEKFALADIVDAKVGAWRDGKRDNLRALLGSLDTVMWEGAGWKKVGMHELITNGKVKINYMKAIGKCHPDKLAQDASTEVRMIAALVFATLNESWDKFKEQNGM